MLLAEMNWDFIEILLLILTFVIGFFATYFIIPRIIRLMVTKNYVGMDIHKNSRPKVAESGGISIIIGFAITSVLLMMFFPEFANETLIFALTVIFSGLIGFIDDRIKLKSRYKLILTLLTGVIIFVANFIGFINIQSPTIPFLGKLRLTLIYPFVVPIVVAVFTNTVNMLEGYNGEGSGISIITLMFILICAILWNSTTGILYTSISLAVLIPFYIFNKYPAKIFPGDVGTLSIGAIFAGIALFASLEAAVFCALFIHVFNSFYVLYSVKGFFESSEIQETKSDVILLKNDVLKASDQKDAALTLPRLILAHGNLKEHDLVKNLYAISVICGLFAIFTTLMMAWTINQIQFVLLLVVTPILLAILLIMLIIFPKIRGIIALMLLLMVAGYILLMLIETFIMPVEFINFIVFGISIPTNIIISLIIVIPCLLVWYLISIRYFWYAIEKMKLKSIDTI
jgi:UDP-N-acetylglucosamine--dolichyl-phosphate N-acetylglucosaminephosphotransferase